MVSLKAMTDKAIGTVKEVTAEISGDAKLQEEGKMQKHRGVEHERDDRNPMSNLDKLT